MKNRLIKAAAILSIATLALTACTGSSEFNQRKDAQEKTTLTESLGTANLAERLKREEDPTAIRYLYLMNFGQIVGYYVTKGKISSSAGQLAPEQDIICRYNSGESCNPVDSAKDDGTYGPGDPGIFFFTTENVMVETSLDYIQSDAPLSIDVPRLGGNDKK